MVEYQVWWNAGGTLTMAARLTDKRELARYIRDVAVVHATEIRIVVVTR